MHLVRPTAIALLTATNFAAPGAARLNSLFILAGADDK